MNKFKQLFKSTKNILSIYYTAGYPYLNDTSKILKQLLQCPGVNMIEIGIPFSDPIADGPVIQEANTAALKNKMNLTELFNQLNKDKKSIINSQIPLILMGYLNTILQYGIKKFCMQANHVGISGVIIPDLPIDIYVKEFKTIFNEYNLNVIFLVTPQTSTHRIIQLDNLSCGFIYAVSSSTITGNRASMNNSFFNYLKKLKSLNLKKPILVGFGVTNRNTFNTICKYADGAIIGTAFIKHISSHKPVCKFINSIR